VTVLAGLLNKLYNKKKIYCPKMIVTVQH